MPVTLKLNRELGACRPPALAAQIIAAGNNRRGHCWRATRNAPAPETCLPSSVRN